MLSALGTHFCWLDLGLPCCNQRWFWDILRNVPVGTTQAILFTRFLSVGFGCWNTHSNQVNYQSGTQQSISMLKSLPTHLSSVVAPPRHWISIESALNLGLTLTISFGLGITHSNVGNHRNYHQWLYHFCQSSILDAAYIPRIYNGGSEEDENFIANLGLFFTNFFKVHLHLVESNQSTASLVISAHKYLVGVSNVEHKEVFKTCLEYWLWLVWRNPLSC